MPRKRKWLIAFGVLAAAAAGVVVFTKVWVPLGGRVEKERVARSPQWRDGTFHNVDPTYTMSPGRTWETLRRQFGGREKRVPDGPIPIARMDVGREAGEGLRAVWIGHASTLVDIDGVRVLTDPIWSERCSPFASLGPRRFHPPPIALEDLGRVDAVVISHDHYDHLDMNTIRALAPKGVVFFVPLGIGAHLERWGVPAPQVRELDWNEHGEVRGVRFQALPARHYSGRGLTTKDETLWASWAIVGPVHRVFFSGDTGIHDTTSVGRTLGPFDLTLIKIGAYGETWPEIHMTPEEAVQMHEAVRGKLMLPVHWGTFNLAFHDWFEPADRFVRAANGRIAYVVPRPGEVVDPAQAAPVEAWWKH